MTTSLQQALDAAATAVAAALQTDGDADDALRAAVAAVQSGVPGYSWVGISFVDEGSLLLGPWAGTERGPGDPPPLRVPIRFQGTTVAELGIDGPSPVSPGEEAALGRLADLLAAYCLVGWDTGGIPWDEL